jgi:hypothetical protein
MRQFSSALDNPGHYATTVSASNLDYVGFDSANNSNLVMNMPTFNQPSNNRSYMQGGFSS